MKLENQLSYVGNVNGLLDYLQNTEDELAENQLHYCKFCGQTGRENCQCKDEE